MLNLGRKGKYLGHLNEESIQRSATRQDEIAWHLIDMVLVGHEKPEKMPDIFSPPTLKSGTNAATPSADTSTAIVTASRPPENLNAYETLVASNAVAPHSNVSVQSDFVSKGSGVGGMDRGPPALGAGPEKLGRRKSFSYQFRWLQDGPRGG